MIKFNLICLIICLLIKFKDCHVFDEKLFLDNLKGNDVLEQLYYPYLNKTINLIDLLLDNSIHLNNKCAYNLNQIKNGLLMKERWALLYYESNGFPKNGRLNGDYNNLGYFDQCLSIPDNEMNNKFKFDTKFCLISINTPEWNQLIEMNNDFNNYFNPLQESTKEMFKFSFGKIIGVCLPSECDTSQILNIINNRLLLSIGLNATSQKYCSTKNSKSNQPFTFSELISISIFACTITLCLLSEFIFTQNSFFSHFSISKNFSRIYDYDPNDSKIRSTDYLHGLKTILVSCSILLHCFGIVIFQSPFLFSKIRYYDAGKYQILFDRAFLFADQLFFFGGFFAMFSWYDSIKKINISLYRYIFTRFIRIFVVSVMIILIIFILPLIANGPYYLDLTEKCSTNCVRNFWKNLLFINNLFDSYQEICWLPTWYSSADFQLYLVNYLLIYLLVKKPKIGLRLAAFELISGSIIVIIYDYLKNRPYYYKYTTSMNSLSTFKLEEHYLPTIYHSNTFVIGILCAWIIKSGIKFKFLDKKINRTFVTIMALFSFIIAMSLPDIWEKCIIKKNDLLIIIWSVIDKMLVCFSIGWAFYATSLNYYVNLRKFLSLRCWIPISQISFSMVMCQFLYFYYMTGTQKFLYTFELSNILKEFIFSFTVTYLISNLTFILFEMPITNLLLKLFNLNRRRDIKLESNSNNHNKFDNKLDKKLDNKLDNKLVVSNYKFYNHKIIIKYDYNQYNYIEINNNNPDFEPPINKKLD